MLLDASGNPISAAYPAQQLSQAHTLAVRQLTRLVERMDSSTPKRVPTVFGAIEARRSDRWTNPSTGIGSVMDKSRHGFFDAVWRLPDSELSNLMNGSDLASKIVEKRPKEMFRRGFDLKANATTGAGKAGGNKASGKAEIDQSAIKDFRDFCTEKLLLEDRFKQGMIWGRLFGGALMLLGIDDGQDPEEPLDEERLKGFTFLNVIDRRFCWVHSYYADPGAAKFGEPETYMITNGVAAQDYRPMKMSSVRRKGWSSQVVHESRVMRFDGVATDMLTRQQLAGWSWSVLQRVYEVLRQFDHGFDSATYLLSDASQGVYKLKGLLQAIGSGNKEFLEQRLQIMEDTRSVMRGIAIDADEKSGESFERTATPLTGIADLIDRLMQRVSAGADMPVQELFGAGAGGLNAAGEAQAATRKWYDTIRTEAQGEAAPKLARLFRLAALAGNSPLKRKDTRFTVTFHPMWEPTDDELAGTRLKNAQRDDLYIGNGTVSPEVVALSGLKDIYQDIDEDEIRDAVEAKKTFDPHEGDPPPVPPTVPGAPGVPPVAGAVPAKPGAPPQKTPAPTGSAEQTALGGGGSGEQQSPTMPLAGPPGDEGRKPKPKDEVDGRGDGNTPLGSRAGTPGLARRKTRAPHLVREAVRTQLSERFPSDAYSWIDDVPWTGPRRVPLDQIDTSGRDSWAASHEPEKVAKHVDKIEAGDEKPVVLVKPPGAKLKVMDGHHHVLAYEKSGRTPLAYIAPVPSHVGAWDEMHTKQDSAGTLRWLDEQLEGRQDALEAGDVFRQLLGDYDAKDLGWVLAAQWRREKVPVADIDTMARETWTASHDDNLHKHVGLLESGASPPTILIKPPGGPYVIVDGHHRTLASDVIGRDVDAYVADVQVKHGPWDVLHAAQKRGSSKGSFSVPAWGSVNQQATTASRGDAGMPDAAIVVLFGQGGRVLTVSRPAAEGGEMALPGGEIEGTESAQAAAAREVYEETNVWAYAPKLDLVAKVISPTDGRCVHVFSYKLEEPNVQIPRANETGTSVAWLRPEELIAQATRFRPTLDELVRQGVLVLSPAAPSASVD